MERLAEFLYERWKNALSGFSAVDKIRRKLERIYPGAALEEKWRQHCVDSIKGVLWVLCVGLVLAAVAALYFHLSDGEVALLTRSEYGQGSRQLQLTASRSDGVTTEHELQLQERLYTEAEVEKLYEELVERLNGEIKKEVVYGNEEKEAMVLPGEVEGYPFVLSWSSDRPEVLDAVGQFGETEPDPGVAVEVTLTAVFRYPDFERSASWLVRVLPPEIGEQEQWRRAVERSLVKEEENSAYDSALNLPQEIEGESVTWREKRENPAGIILLLTALCAAFVLWSQQRKVSEQAARREAGLEEEYSTLVTRLVLYLGAGMTVKGAWQKTASAQWGKGRSYACEEMRLVCRELESGAYESACYEKFGWRCGRQEYIKLGALLAQNVKKGNSALLQSLRQEVKAAREQQKHIVRRKGEEASTKLLGPMLLLLGMILIIIMVPAFQTMG